MDFPIKKTSSYGGTPVTMETTSHGCDAQGAEILAHAASDQKSAPRRNVRNVAAEMVLSFIEFHALSTHNLT